MAERLGRTIPEGWNARASVATPSDYMSSHSDEEGAYETVAERGGSVRWALGARTAKEAVERNTVEEDSTMRGNGVAQSDARQQTDTRRQASDMWVGTRTMCGETCMVVGITVGQTTSVFLAAPAVVERLADQIATIRAVPGAGVPDGLVPRRFSQKGTARTRVA